MSENPTIYYRHEGQDNENDHYKLFEIKEEATIYFLKLVQEYKVGGKIETE
jgi:hypothetical protein